MLIFTTPVLQTFNAPNGWITKRAKLIPYLGARRTSILQIPEKILALTRDPKLLEVLPVQPKVVTTAKQAIGYGGTTSLTHVIAEFSAGQMVAESMYLYRYAIRNWGYQCRFIAVVNTQLPVDFNPTMVKAVVRTVTRRTMIEALFAIQKLPALTPSLV